MNQRFELYHGDCLQILPTLDDNSVDAVITDPPYGILKDKIETDVDIPAFFNECHRILKPNSFIVFFGRQPTLTTWNTEAFKVFRYKMEIIWYKRQASSMVNDMGRVFENITVCVKGGRKFNDVRRNYTDVVNSIAEFMNISTFDKMFSYIKQFFKSEDNYKEGIRYLSAIDKTEFYLKKCIRNNNVTMNSNAKQTDTSFRDLSRVVNGYKPQNLISFRPHNKQKYDSSV